MTLAIPPLNNADKYQLQIPVIATQSLPQMSQENRSGTFGPFFLCDLPKTVEYPLIDCFSFSCLTLQSGLHHVPDLC